MVIKVPIPKKMTISDNAQKAPNLDKHSPNRSVYITPQICMTASNRPELVLSGCGNDNSTPNSIPTA